MDVPSDDTSSEILQNNKQEKVTPQQQTLSPIKTETEHYEEIHEFTTDLDSSIQFINKEQDPRTTSKLHPDSFPLEVKPNIPLLFIDNEKKNGLCNICERKVLSPQKSVHCSNKCGRRQHFDCILFNSELKEASGDGILWKCNECCALGMSTKFASSSSSSPLRSLERTSSALACSREEGDDDPLGDQMILALKERQLHQRNFVPFASSPKHCNMDPLSTEVEDTFDFTRSQILVDEKRVLDYSFDMSNISIDGTLADDFEFSPKKEPDDNSSDAWTDTNCSNPEGKSKEYSKMENNKNKLSHNIVDKENKNSIIEYVIIKRGSRMGRPKLYDSLGYSYIIRIVSKYTVWQCVRCNGWQKCQAHIKQNGKVFFRSQHQHQHKASLAEFAAAKQMSPEFKIDNEVIFCRPSKPKIFKPESDGKKKATESKSSRTIKPMNLKEKVIKRKKKESSKLIKTNASKQKSSYVELRSESGEMASKLLDSSLGFSYNLHKTTERTKLWLCTMSESSRQCEASVKQVGKYFIRSTLKHTHAINMSEFNRNKKILNKKTPKATKQQVRAMKAANSPASAVVPSNKYLCHHDAVRKPSLSAASSHGKENSVKGGRRTSSSSSAASASSTLSKKKKRASLPPKNQVHSQQEEDGAKSSPTTALKKSTPLLIPKEVELELVECFLALDQCGLFLTNKIMIDTARDYFRVSKENYFGNKKPNRAWVSKVVECYSELSSKYVSHSSYYDVQSLAMNRGHLFFKNLGTYLNSNYNVDIKDLLSKRNAHRVFNCDSLELVVNANSSSGTIKKLSLNVKQGYAKEDKRRTMDVLCTISADGQSLKPLIINKGEHVFKYESHEILDKSYDKLCSDDGEVTRPVFSTWLSQNFNRYLVEKNVERPVLLFLNGSRCFVSHESMKFAKEHGIIFYHIPIYTARTLQPISVTLLPALRRRYQKIFEESLNSNTKQLPQKLFPMVFMKAYYSIEFSALSQLGFSTARIVPMNASGRKRKYATHLANAAAAAVVVSVGPKRRDGDDHAQPPPPPLPRKESATPKRPKSKRIRTKKDANKAATTQEHDHVPPPPPPPPSPPPIPPCPSSLPLGAKKEKNKAATTQDHDHDHVPPPPPPCPSSLPLGAKKEKNKTPRTVEKKRERVKPEDDNVVAGTRMSSQTTAVGADRISLRNGYNLALDNVEKLIATVVDPSVLNVYKQKFEAEAEYPDTTFLVWRGLQQLKEVPDILLNL